MFTYCMLFLILRTQVLFVVALIKLSEVDPGSPRGGGTNPRGEGANLLFGQFFVKTA